jgi:hypothetical protein
MSYCNKQKMLLSLYQRGFTPVWSSAKYDGQLVFVGHILEAASDELCWVKGCFGRRRMKTAVIHRLSGGANL